MNQDLLAFLKEEEERSYDATLLSEVEAAIKSYNCEPYGDEDDGRSQVVASDVSETADYMLTSIMDVFAGSGRVVEFEPVDEGAEQACDDATEALHQAYRKKSGFRFIHDWAKAGLLEKIAISKSCVERKRKRVEQLYHPAMMPDNAIEAEETEELHPVDGSPMIKAVTLEEGAASFPDYFVPLEEFRVSPDARDLDTAIYLAHVCEKTLSELAEMGFDDLNDLQGDNPNDTGVAFARDDGRSQLAGERLGALRKVWLAEEYVLFDLNGDGLAERLCVHRVGSTILNIEEVDYQPFEFWCPFPMQGRLIGQSLADKTIDFQRVNTALQRNMLDTLYFSTAPGTYVDENFVGDHTIDDLLTVRPGRIVRTKGGYPQPEVRPDTSPSAMAAMEFFTRQRESRTGITRLNKGVDEDTLNDTAAGQKMLMTRGQQMERYVIRNFGEGVARLFMKKVGLMRAHGQPFTIRVDGEYRQVDPSQWPENMEIDVKVGLGSGQKDERIAYRQLVAQAHEMLKGAGSPLVTDDNIYNNLTAIAKDMGLQPHDIFTEPEKDEQGNPVPQQQAPDPEMIKAQIEAQKAQAKQQIEEQQAMHKAQLAEADMQRKMEEAYAKHQLEQFKAQAKAQDDLQRREFEAKLAIAELQFEQKLAAQKQKDDHEIAKNRPGGNLSK